MQYAVEKSTQKKLKPLKLKHITTLTSATYNRHELSDMMRMIHERTREPNWIIVFKCLIVIHILIREGSTNQILEFLVRDSSTIDTSSFRDKSLNPLSVAQARNLRAYSIYLEEKVASYKVIRDDFVRSKSEMIARIRSLPVDDGLLAELELLQRQIGALLGCTFYLEEIDNVVTLQAFRLLVGDNMALFHLMNEGVIRILTEYFEMSKDDAKKALTIYKTFAQQTTKTVEFFEIARRLRGPLGIDVPEFKHAPLSLASALEDYLKAPDFETQRVAYREKRALSRKSKEDISRSKPDGAEHPSKGAAVQSFRDEATVFVADPPKKPNNPEPLIDFFSSLDEELNNLSSPTAQANFGASIGGSVWIPPTLQLGQTNPFGAANIDSNLLTANTLTTNSYTGFNANNSMQLQTTSLQQPVMNPFMSIGSSNVTTNYFDNVQPVPAALSTTPFTVENVFGGGGSVFDAHTSAHALIPTKQATSSMPSGSILLHGQQPWFGNIPSTTFNPTTSSLTQQQGPISTVGAFNSNAMASSGPLQLNAVTDHLASLNPFAKPSVPLASLGPGLNSSINSGQPIANWPVQNTAFSASNGDFVRTTQQQDHQLMPLGSNPFASSQQKVAGYQGGNANNPFLF